MRSTAAAKWLQSRRTLCDPIDGSPTGSALPGIFQARTLEWVAITSPLPRGSEQSQNSGRHYSPGQSTQSPHPGWWGTEDTSGPHTPCIFHTVFWDISAVVPSTGNAPYSACFIGFEVYSIPSKEQKSLKNTPVARLPWRSSG